MPLGFGLGLSYSPLMYRPRCEWAALYRKATSGMPQTAAALAETETALETYEQRLRHALSTVEMRLHASESETLVMLIADRDQYFEDSNRPQIHVFSGEAVWGCSDDQAADSAANVACDEETADLLIEELAFRGFDIAESRGDFRPLGNPRRGVVEALHCFARRFAADKKVVPVHINCHAEPRGSGNRLFALGTAIADALRLSGRRIGIVASGGLSGNPGGYMAGWMDATLDRWALNRILQGRSIDLAPIFQVRSNSLSGGASEYRLWLVASAAMEACDYRAELIDYLPLHHAATAIGLVCWEPRQCQ